MNASLSVDFATREAALAAAEAGNAAGADCSILRAIEDSITPPAENHAMTEVRRLQGRHASATGHGPRQHLRPRRDSTSCPLGCGTARPSPYTPGVGQSYDECKRCNDLAGLQGPAAADNGRHDRRPDVLRLRLGDAAALAHADAGGPATPSSRRTRCGWSRSCESADALRRRPASAPGSAARAVEFAIVIPVSCSCSSGCSSSGSPSPTT